MTGNPVFVRMLALHFHSRTFAQKLRFFLFRVTEKRVLSFFFLMQFDIILIEFLRNTTDSLGDVYIRKKNQTESSGLRTGSNEERCKLPYIVVSNILKSVFCLNFSSSCLTSLTELTVREEIIFFYF